MASPGTRRRAGSYSATARRSKSSTCCWRSAARCTRNCVWVCGSPRSSKDERRLCRCVTIRANFAAVRWWSQPAVPRFRKWDRAASDIKSPSNSALRHRAAARGAGALDVRRRAACAIWGSVGRFGRGGRRVAARHASTRRLLFTHRGLSGPAILQISSYWREGQDIVVDMAPGIDVLAGLKKLRAHHPKAGNGDRAGRLRSEAAGAEHCGRDRQVRSGSPISPISYCADACRGGEGVARQARRDRGLSHRGGDAGRRRHIGAFVEDVRGHIASPGFISSAKSSTSPAISAASIFNGPGRRDTPRAGTSRDGRPARYAARLA